MGRFEAGEMGGAIPQFQEVEGGDIIGVLRVDFFEEWPGLGGLAEAEEVLGESAFGGEKGGIEGERLFLKGGSFLKPVTAGEQNTGAVKCPRVLRQRFAEGIGLLEVRSEEGDGELEGTRLRGVFGKSRHLFPERGVVFELEGGFGKREACGGVGGVQFEGLPPVFTGV
jgi:hypothetical protein